MSGIFGCWHWDGDPALARQVVAMTMPWPIGGRTCPLTGAVGILSVPFCFRFGAMNKPIEESPG